ncbi:MAG: DUF4337 domain-containing protein [Beijerinckiaceae bacterium]
MTSARKAWSEAESLLSHTGDVMEESPTEHFEHAEHAQHVAHMSDAFLSKVSMTIAILAVLAATVGSLETIETAGAISEKNHAVLLQNKATDNWNFYQAKSIKKNLYDIAAITNPDHKDDFDKDARRNEADQKEIIAKAKELEHQSDESLEKSDHHEHRHHILTVAVTLLHVSIAIATISIIMRGQRWPWLASMGLGAAGIVGAAFAYLG